MRPMTAHEKECALAACALRLERAISDKNRCEAREWRYLMREIISAPLDNLPERNSFTGFLS